MPVGAEYWAISRDLGVFTNHAAEKEQMLASPTADVPTELARIDPLLITDPYRA
jgi:hypothetical protein